MELFKAGNFHNFMNKFPFMKILPSKCLLKILYHQVLLMIHDFFCLKKLENRLIHENFPI